MPDQDKGDRQRAAQQKRIMFAAIALAIGVVAMMLSGVKPSYGQGATATGQFNTGAMAAFVYKPASVELAPIKFVDAEGREKSLKDWSGKVVLLNLWATWCLPCRKEMPDLDRLQSELGSAKFEVVALGVDRAGIPGAKKFLEATGVKTLALFVDPTAKIANELKVIGLPATLLLDAEGREIGRLLGPAEWASEDAKALIKSIIK
jgi:thiol-disulfide isomerase/thioredoxin